LLFFGSFDNWNPYIDPVLRLTMADTRYVANGRQVDFVSNAQITGRGPGHPALTHLKGQAVSGVPSALEAARSRALANLLSDFSLG